MGRCDSLADVDELGLPCDLVDIFNYASSDFDRFVRFRSARWGKWPFPTPKQKYNVMHYHAYTRDTHANSTMLLVNGTQLTVQKLFNGFRWTASLLHWHAARGCMHADFNVLTGSKIAKIAACQRCESQPYHYLWSIPWWSNPNGQCPSFVAGISRNVATGCSASQVSTYATAIAALSVDGSVNTPSCTDYAPNPWWAVDLGSPMYIRGVQPTNEAYMSKQLVSW
jgi:hypothetical protein